MRSVNAALALAAFLLCGHAALADDLSPTRPDRPWVGDTYVLPPNRDIPLPTAPPQFNPRHAYTLPELIDIAQSANPSTRVAWAEARIAAQGVGLVEATFLPNLSALVLGGYQWGQGRSTVSNLHSDTASTAVSALTLQWLLFDFGQRSARLEAARQQTAMADIAFTAEHQNVIYKVSLAFYAHAAARARGANAVTAAKDAQDVQAAAEDRLRHGIGTIVEVARSRQATAQVTLALVQARGAADDSYAALLAAMGISPLTTIRVADPAQRDFDTTVISDVDKVVADALARRTDVQSANSARLASLARLKAAEADYLPKIFMSATGYYATARVDSGAFSLGTEQLPTANLAANRSGVTVLLGVKIPIFDGGIRDANVAQARADNDRTAALTAQAVTEATRQVVMAQNAVKTSIAAWRAARALETAAQTTFDAALASWHHGVGSITDVTLAEMQLLQARDAAAESHSTALSAAASLALATGILGAAPE
jgi:outer membrane protein TolC